MKLLLVQKPEKYYFEVRKEKKPGPQLSYDPLTPSTLGR